MAGYIGVANMSNAPSVILVRNDVLSGQEFTNLITYVSKHQHRFVRSNYAEEFKNSRVSGSLVPINPGNIIRAVRHTLASEIKSSCDYVGLDSNNYTLEAEIVCYPDGGIFSTHKDEFGIASGDRKVTGIYSFQLGIYEEQSGGNITVYGSNSWNDIVNNTSTIEFIPRQSNQLVMMTSNSFYEIGEYTCRDVFSAYLFHLMFWLS